MRSPPSSSCFSRFPIAPASPRQPHLCASRHQVLVQAGWVQVSLPAVPSYLLPQGGHRCGPCLSQVLSQGRGRSCLGAMALPVWETCGSLGSSEGAGWGQREGKGDGRFLRTARGQCSRIPRGGAGMHGAASRPPICQREPSGSHRRLTELRRGAACHVSSSVDRVWPWVSTQLCLSNIWKLSKYLMPKLDPRL